MQERTSRVSPLAARSRIQLSWTVMLNIICLTTTGRDRQLKDLEKSTLETFTFVLISTLHTTLKRKASPYTKPAIMLVAN